MYIYTFHQSMSGCSSGEPGHSTHVILMPRLHLFFLKPSLLFPILFLFPLLFPTYSLFLFIPYLLFIPYMLILRISGVSACISTSMHVHIRNVKLYGHNLPFESDMYAGSL